MEERRVTEAEARDILLKAGVDPKRIDGIALLFTAILLDVIAQRMTTVVVEKIVDDMIKNNHPALSTLRNDDTIH